MLIIIFPYLLCTNITAAEAYAYDSSPPLTDSNVKMKQKLLKHFFME